MRFSYDKVKSIVPRDSVYVTIMREPGRLFHSTFAYMRDVVPSFKCYPLGEQNAAEKWLNNSQRCIQQTSHKSRRWYRYAMFRQNHMAFDLGYDYEMNNATEISEAIKKIDSVFDLVLITDYMDESLVLLAYLLCLSLEEMASLKIHERQNKDLTPIKMERLSRKARDWNKADAALFDFFNASLWKKIERFGFERMAAEVAKLRRINQRMQNLCLDNTTTSSSESLESHLADAFWKTKCYEPQGVVLKHLFLKESAMKIEECTYMVASPTSFTRHAFVVQNKTKKFRRLNRFDNEIIKNLQAP